MPAFGPNVLVVGPADVSTPEKTRAVQAKIDAIYAAEQHSEFGPRRDAVVLLPGEYALDVPVGFYTEVMGVGASPGDVRVRGDVHADAALENNNATTTFWRAVEGMEVTPPSGTMQWAVSQATSLRRMHVRGDLVLHQQHGWASGGWMADTRVDGTVDSGTQQQWISRNCDWKTWTGSNWNMVFVGVPEAPATTWPKPAWTTVAKAPMTRERPFLVVDKAGAWGVRVPAVARDSAGVTWDGGETPGRTVPIDRFYVTHEGTDYGGDDERRAGGGQEPAGDAGDLRARFPSEGDAQGHSCAGNGICHAEAGTRNGGDGDGGCRRHRGGGATVRCG